VVAEPNFSIEPGIFPQYFGPGNSARSQRSGVAAGGKDFRSHVAVAFGTFVLLRGKNGTGEADHGIPDREYAGEFA
jgi:hypothetical protein